MELSPWVSWGHLQSGEGPSRLALGWFVCHKGRCRGWCVTLHPPSAAGTLARAVWGGVPACCPGVGTVSASCGLQGRAHHDISLCHSPPGSRGGSLGPKHLKTGQPLAGVRWVLCSLSQPWGGGRD